jgi:phosphohistidine phosphatase
MSSRRLVLIRHAKAEAHASSDAARTLAVRGRRDAAGVGRWLAEQGIEPELVLISPAQRTRETWELAGAEIRSTPRSVIEPRLYENTIEDVLQAIQEVDPDIAALVIVGHNPSIEGVAVTLDDGSGPASRDDMRRGFPTSGVAVLSVEGEWADVGPERATLERFATPRG